MRRAIMASLILMFATAATAGAADTNPVPVAIAKAERYWNAVPCGGAHIAVYAAQGSDPQVAALRQPAGVSTVAYSDWENPHGHNSWIDPLLNTNCKVTYVSDDWPDWPSIYRDWPNFCATMTHEVGHLLGHQHVPGGVMDPVVRYVPLQCQGKTSFVEGGRLVTAWFDARKGTSDYRVRNRRTHRWLGSGVWPAGPLEVAIQGSQR